MSIHTLKANDYKIIEQNFFTLGGFHHSDSCSKYVFKFKFPWFFRTIFCEFKPGADRRPIRFL